jgi:hypothetical protein
LFCGITFVSFPLPCILWSSCGDLLCILYMWGILIDLLLMRIWYRISSLEGLLRDRDWPCQIYCRGLIQIRFESFPSFKFLLFCVCGSFRSNWTQSRLLFSPRFALQCREGSCQKKDSSQNQQYFV